MSYGQFLPDFEVIGPFTLWPGEMYAYDYQLPGGKSVTGMISDLSAQLKEPGCGLVGPVRYTTVRSLAPLLSIAR